MAIINQRTELLPMIQSKFRLLDSLIMLGAIWAAGNSLPTSFSFLIESTSLSFLFSFWSNGRLAFLIASEMKPIPTWNVACFLRTVWLAKRNISRDLWRGPRARTMYWGGRRLWWYSEGQDTQVSRITQIVPQWCSRMVIKILRKIIKDQSSDKYFGDKLLNTYKLCFKRIKRRQFTFRLALGLLKKKTKRRIVCTEVAINDINGLENWNMLVKNLLSGRSTFHFLLNRLWTNLLLI